MSSAILAVTPLTLQTALARVREALAAEGFEILSEIDVQAMLREQVGVEIEPYLLLEALGAGHRTCNVVVRLDDGETVAEAVGPVAPELRDAVARVVESAAA